MSHGGSVKAVFYALGANTGIALAKFAAAAYTGSGAMLAEAIHSTADCANQGLLLLGMRQARAPESEDHPLGHHRVVYFWSMTVALLLFFVGGAFSVYEGVERILHPEPVNQPWVALGVLGVAVVLESFSLWGAMKEIRRIAGGKSFPRWFRETRESELMVVAGEDIAALAGLAIAFVAVGLTVLLHNALFDALGSITVGLILMGVAIVLMREIKSLIVGESAAPEVRAAITAFVQAQPEVERVFRIITLAWGDRLVIAVKAGMRENTSASKLIEDINNVEARIQERFPNARWVFFEPDTR